ncbi:ATP-binding cassette domain-containing protein [Actinoplanes sp. NPDC000266]
MAARRRDIWWWRLAVPFIVVGLWQLLHQLGVTSRVLLPSPYAVWSSGLDLHSSGVLWPNLWSTTSAALAALALSAVVGVPAGILLGMLPRTWAVLAPYLNAVNSMPRIALAPVFLVALGIGQGSKIALGFSIAVFVFLMNARIGVLSADEDHLRMCTALGASRFQLFRKLYVPVAVPAIFTALRLGIVFALLGVVGSEIIASKAGVGQLITTYSATLSMAPVYALLIILAAFTSLLTLLAGALEAASLRWQRPDRRPGRAHSRTSKASAAPAKARTGPQPIRIRSVSVRFPGEGPVLDDLSMDIPGGQFIAIVGASGIGKSTLLNVVSGLVPVSSGEVTVFGRPPRAGRTDVGYMFARDALLPWRTARRNVELGLELQGSAPPARRERALQMLDLVRLSGAEEKYPSQLSQGMRQRVALARTLASDPELLLMDEPFAALDALTRSSLRDMLLEIWDGEAYRKTVLFVTHDLAEALVLADRVITLADGGVRTDVEVPYGRPRDQRALMARADYRALYDRLQADL